MKAIYSAMTVALLGLSSSALAADDDTALNVNPGIEESGDAARQPTTRRCPQGARCTTAKSTGARPTARVVPPQSARPAAHPRPGHQTSRPVAIPAHRPATAQHHPAPRPPAHRAPPAQVRATVQVRRSAPAKPRIQTHYKTVHYHHVRPYHGVFVYGPRPVHHTTYTQSNVEVREKDLPTRKNGHGWMSGRISMHGQMDG